MTKTRAQQYWRIMKHAKDLSDTEAALLAEVMKKLNEPTKKRLK